MLIYILLVLTILILNIERKNGRISDRTYCKIICIAFILITGLRHNDVGSDTTVYYNGFNNGIGLSLSSVLASHEDKGFYFIWWLIQNYVGKFEILTVLIACVFYIPVTTLIYRYSDDYGMSFLSLMAFNFFQFSMTGMRQTMALGFTALVLLELLKDKTNLIKLVFFIALGISMHRSCWIILLYLLIYWISTKVLNRKAIWLTLLIVPIVYVLRTDIVVLGINLYDSEKIIANEISGGGGLTTYLVYILLLIIGFFERDNYFLDDYGGIVKRASFDVLVMIVGTSLLGLVMVESVFFRVAWYFSIYLVIYLPRLVEKFSTDGSTKGIASVVVYVMLLIMYFVFTKGSATVLPYKFFWQIA